MADDDAQSAAAATAPAEETPGTPADAAKARREARKAKILNSGSDRLARITRSGRGPEADALYASPPPPLGPASPSSASGSTAATTNAQSSARSLSARASPGIVDEEPLGGPLAGKRASDDPLGLGAGAGLTDGADGQAGFDLATMLTRLQQAAAARGLGGPPGEGGEAGGLPFDLNQLLALAGMAQPGAGADGSGPPPPGGAATGAGSASAHPGAHGGGRSKLDKTFDLLRALVMIAFAGLAVSSLFSRPTTNLNTGQAAGVVSHDDHQAHLLQRWASLAYRKPAEWEAQFFQMESFGLSSTAAVPIFWLFLSVEVALQSSRILLDRGRPAPPSILNTALNILPVPPQLAQLIRTGASYLGLLTALLNDLAIVLFGVGMTIMWARWRTGMTAESASTLGGVWDAATTTAAGAGKAALNEAGATAAAAAGAVSDGAGAAWDAVTSALNAGTDAAMQRAAEL